MAKRPATPEAKARYAKRKRLSEVPNGWIKEAMGFRSGVRGLAKARGRVEPVACLALNVRRTGRLAVA